MHLIIKFYRTEFNLYLMIQQAYQNHAVLRGHSHHHQLQLQWKRQKCQLIRVLAEFLSYNNL